MNPDENELPWLQEAWERLNKVRVQGRLPHALLLIGQDGLGKRILAERLAAALLCEQPGADGRPCGHCSACGWLQADTHPDLLLLEPEETGKAIKVDQVRRLCRELGMTSHGGRYKIAIVHPADAMNVNAANSLLKTLEEPTDSTLLVLLSAAPGRLPATIRSRCQRVQINVPDGALALHWLESAGTAKSEAAHFLKLASGAPLKAHRLAQSDSSEVRLDHLAQLQAVFDAKMDPLQAAADWMGETERQGLEWWRTWLEEMVRWKMAGQVPVEPGVAQMLHQIVKAVDCRQLFDLSDRVTDALNTMGSGLNRQLVLEDLMICWAKLANRTLYRSKAVGR